MWINSFSGDLILDQEHGLFRLKNDENALVFEMKDLISFQVLEDSRPLFISEGKNLRTFQSDVPEKANAMAPQIGQFVLMRQQFENMENMARMLEKQGGDQKQDRYDSSNRSERPYFDVPAPFESFFVDLETEPSRTGGVSAARSLHQALSGITQVWIPT